MPQPSKGARLGGSPAHERLMLANLATSLFRHGKIRTTEAKARRLRPFAERLVTFAKRGDLASRRRTIAVLRDREIVHALFEEIAPRYVNRPGGYTRTVKIGPRKGDNAPMAVIELVEELEVAEPEPKRRRPARKAARAESVAALAGDVDDEAAPVAARAAEPATNEESAPETAGEPEPAGTSEASADADEAAGPADEDKPDSR